MNDLYIDTEHNIIDLNIKSYTEDDLKLYDNIFAKYIGGNLVQLIDIQHKYESIGSRKIITSGIQEYFDMLFKSCCPTILKGKIHEQQLYQLHLTSILFNRYNTQKLKIDIDEYWTTIYFPNVLNFCAKYLPHARKYIHRIIRLSFDDFKVKSSDLVSYYSELYGVDQKLLINDINYFFLGEVIGKFDPICLPDVESIYYNVLQRMFYFYLTSKVSKRNAVKFQNSTSYNIGYNNVSTERYRLYEEALYLAQLYQTCDKSNIATQIDDKLIQFKQNIISNELQKLLIFKVNNSPINRMSNRDLIIEVFTNNYDFEYFKNFTPIIYRLLRSIHIKNATSCFSNSDIEYIRPIIISTLNSIFQNYLNQDAIKTVIPKITETLIASLMIGEYIDVSTMTVVNIPIFKFSTQLTLFLKKVLIFKDQYE